MSDKELISKETLQKLEETTKKIIEIKNHLRIGTTSLTPLNYSSEMEKFLKSNTYNPQYVYKEQTLIDYSSEIEELKIKINNLEIPSDLKEHILELLEDLRNLYLTKLSIGKSDFSKNSHKLFDWGTDRLDILLAKTSDVAFQIYISHKMQNAQKIKERFEKVLDVYKLTSFKIRVDSFSSHIISAGYKTIGIGNSIQRYECNVDRLIVHEIESHILQTENIKRSPTSLSELSKYGNQNLYAEGLAVYNEIITRKITPSAYEMYYYRIKAVRLIHKSFREIYNSLLENLKPTRAFVMTYRVKRGMADTSLSGGFPKDACYLLGFHEIESLVNEGFPKKLLYVTKSPDLTTLLMKYNLIDTKNILIPKFY
mgnify:CR=1 FL=1